MSMKSIFIAGSCITALGLGACAQTDTNVGALDDLQSKVSKLEQQVSEKDRKLAEKDRLLQEASARPAPMTPRPAGAQLLPPNAKAGECYARVYIPPQYRTKTETVLARAESERIETQPPVFKPVRKQILVKAESQRLEVIPARYDWVEERVLVRPAAERLVTTPPVYQNVSERVLVKPAYTTWKKGRGPIEKIDQATGEILCLVEVPAEYKMLTKRVLKTPAATRKVTIPAVYKTVKKRVMVQPPKTKTVTIPAEYRTQVVNELVEGAREKRIKIPATYQQVTKREQISEGRVAWRPILCETNTTPGVVSRLQSALLRAGHDPGRVDGVLGPETMTAVKSYQRTKGLASGQLTMETLKSLGVSL